MKQRYSEEVDYSEYEKRIQTLIDRHVGATEVTRITPLVNIFDKERFDAEVEKLEGSASRADTIASRTVKTIREKWEEDPAFYERFSRILQRLIEDFRNKRISDAQYLASVTEVMQKVRDQGTSELPEALQHRPAARAFYGIIRRALAKLESMLPADAEAHSIELGLAIDEVIAEHARIVNWTANADVRNHMLNAAEDCLLDAARRKGFALPLSALDEIGKELLPVAEAHYHDTNRRQ
ncbi:hypothetical protein SDC9_150995 [bioreactor metagenome]|uniref:Type I restriction enzyme HindI endonuclease subunit-like C-terminal domain-containing protein n=1 Tax=bioreactor metagenome TaxID=1076179 RepID=A0A645EP30_9ZZZZ